MVFIEIPNFINITELQATNILTLSIGALASILGVIIAVILLAFNIFRRGFSFYAFHAFFKDEKLIKLVTVYLLTITISYCTILTLSNPLDFRDINMIYLSIALFFVSLFILFPYSKNIITSTQPRSKIKKLTENINSKFVRSCYNENKSPFRLEEIYENPVIVLRELGFQTLKEDDWLTSISIIKEIKSQLLHLLEILTIDTSESKSSESKSSESKSSESKSSESKSSESQEGRDTINVFLEILKPISRQAIKTEQEEVLYNILKFYESVHEFCANNQIPWYEVIELNEFFESFLEDLISKNINLVYKNGFQTIEEVMGLHLQKNIPKEDEITIDITKIVKHDPKKENQWSEVSTTYIYMMSKLARKAIQLKRDKGIYNALWSLVDIVLKVQKMQIGDLQKREIIRDSCQTILDITIKGFEEDIDISFYNIERLTRGVETAAKDKKEDILKQILFTIIRILVYLTEKNTIDSSNLNIIAALGRGFAGKVQEDPIYNKSFIFIIDTFVMLKKLMEKEIKSSDEYNKQSYIDLYAQTESLKDWLLKNENRDKKLDNLMENTLSDFKHYEEFKDKLEKKVLTIEWPS